MMLARELEEPLVLDPEPGPLLDQLSRFIGCRIEVPQLALNLAPSGEDHFRFGSVWHSVPLDL